MSPYTINANRQTIPNVGQNRTMSLKIPVAHDFSCPWCYIALFQIDKLKRDFDVDIEWLGYELWPEDLDWPESPPPREIFNKPPVPSRLQLMLAAENMELPQVERPKRMRTHFVHLASEYAKEHGRADLFIPEVYRAYWERGEFINEPEILCHIGEQVGLDPVDMQKSTESEAFADRIGQFDVPAYKAGVFNVPTFFIGGERYAEQPYRVLEQAVAQATRELP